jgi:hypothetical protein
LDDSAQQDSAQQDSAQQDSAQQDSAQQDSARNGLAEVGRRTHCGSIIGNLGKNSTALPTLRRGISLQPYDSAGTRSRPKFRPPARF